MCRPDDFGGPQKWHLPDFWILFTSDLASGDARFSGLFCLLSSLLEPGALLKYCAPPCVPGSQVVPQRWDPIRNQGTTAQPPLRSSQLRSVLYLGGGSDGRRPPPATALLIMLLCLVVICKQMQTNIYRSQVSGAVVLTRVKGPQAHSTGRPYHFVCLIANFFLHLLLLGGI